eukprot:CAMPEP_0177649586 /NCGR_PEP_ID=MMETSP0447-20121125/11474_1 /TAXON_ID=0 /ORGANISM="Stygamoeba regulata, Strain BSH-02190019" /LENGTH=75 /DNA_ID=CAMNT_0019152371 /DNA_START=67 /DNA_END=294 /DNA_ORIENTATION=-
MKLFALFLVVAVLLCSVTAYDSVSPLLSPEGSLNTIHRRSVRSSFATERVEEIVASIPGEQATVILFDLRHAITA